MTFLREKFTFLKKHLSPLLYNVNEQSMTLYERFKLLYIMIFISAFKETNNKIITFFILRLGICTQEKLNENSCVL